MASTYKICYDVAEWLSNGGNFMVLQIPVLLNDGYFLVLTDSNGIGVYETTVSPIVDELQFDTQVAYFDWADINQYVADENGDEHWTGYSFYGDDTWTDILTPIAHYYYAITHMTGVIH